MGRSELRSKEHPRWLFTRGDEELILLTRGGGIYVWDELARGI